MVIAALVLDSSCADRSRGRFDLPDLMLWAWQRPEDLRFIDSRTAGVAFLAGTARIGASGVPEFQPRLQPLQLQPGTPVLAVVRIESASPHAPVEVARLIQDLKRVTQLPDIRGLQLDFDAVASEHAFYLSLLDALSAESRVPVGVTALASWCEGDRWLDHTAVAEAVPMFFRMGKGEALNMPITSDLCRSSIGLSMDEPWPRRRPAGLKRIYLFNPRAWNRETYMAALRRLGDWQ